MGVYEKITTPEKRGRGRPIEYPNSPIHVYWRALKQREKERAEQAKAEALAELKEAAE